MPLLDGTSGGGLIILVPSFSLLFQIPRWLFLKVKPSELAVSAGMLVDNLRPMIELMTQSLSSPYDSNRA